MAAAQPRAAISDYAVIGDCRSAALVCVDGSVDWLCLPRFDSPSIFSALLDPERGGTFAVRPASPSNASRRYVDDTNVLETTFTTPSGVLRVTDLMPVDTEAAKAQELWPEHELLRRIECVDGEAAVQVTFEPRFEYGAEVPRIEQRQQGLFYCEHGARVVALGTDLPLHVDGNQRSLAGVERLSRGETRFLSLTYAHGMPAVFAPLGEEANLRIERSIDWWKQWLSALRYDGPYREAVVRSALVLKLLSYAPSGAIVAAPTTSLPEQMGGVRNWDYRYCWLRDASLTLRALRGLGFEIEAESFLSWLVHATRQTWPDVRTMYDVYGESHLRERELVHLGGYGGSRPVRVGNAASVQLQLDAYGELVESAFLWVRRGGTLDRTTRANLVELGRAVCRRWREPDHGIWERRGEPRHHTYSKAMCWLALERLVSLHHSGLLRIPLDEFIRQRDEIRNEIETRGFNERVGSYVSELDGDEVDASLLVLPLHGYIPATHPRMRSTVVRIREHLGAGDLLFRYVEEDGLPPGEGAFGICAFWEIQTLALQGLRREALERFERMLAFANDLGLYAEEFDPSSGAALGNFPQGLTHIGLVNAALELTTQSS